VPKPTPFHPRTSQLCQGQNWEDWSGYMVAPSYELDHNYEYNAIRASCGLLDVSPLFKYHVYGRDALKVLNRMVTRDLSKCGVGQAVYATWCDDFGKVIDDGSIARLRDDFFRITSAIPSLSWLQDNAFGRELKIEDVTDDYAGVSLQGPTSRALLQTLTDFNLGELKYFDVTEAKVASVPAVISRTGFTGDLGYEIFVENSGALQLWDALAESGPDYQMQPAGNIALDMVRIEAGLIQLDSDFISSKQTLFETERSTPYELGLGWMVHLGKDYFVGRDALRDEKARGPAWKTVGLHVDVIALEKLFARFAMPLHLPYTSWTEHVPIYSDQDGRHHVGKATSGTWSSVMKKYCVIARVKPQYGKLGTTINMEATIDGQRFTVPATVVKMPFFDPPRKKG
jgi:aminomethyltransferase